jgi:hypothetical protein
MDLGVVGESGSEFAPQGENFIGLPDIADCEGFPLSKFYI